MADIPLSKLIGSGEFIPLSHSGNLSVSSGAATGAIITITPPAGQRVKLDLLYGATDGITVTAGANVVIDGLNLLGVGSGSGPIGSFSVGNVPGASTGVQVGSTIENITCRYTDDVLVISTLAAATSAVTYAFTYGV